MRKVPWFVLVILAIGLGVVYGGYTVYADAHSGTPGKAKVTGCEGGSKYQPGVHCRGSWEAGGDAIFGEGELAVGPVKGAGYGDVGKTIDVRIHGTDHASVPSMGTPIMLWAVGGLITLFALFSLFSRPPAAVTAGET